MKRGEGRRRAGEEGEGDESVLRGRRARVRVRVLVLLELGQTTRGSTSDCVSRTTATVPSLTLSSSSSSLSPDFNAVSDAQHGVVRAVRVGGAYELRGIAFPLCISETKQQQQQQLLLLLRRQSATRHHGPRAQLHPVRLYINVATKSRDERASFRKRVPSKWAYEAESGTAASRRGLT